MLQDKPSMATIPVKDFDRAIRFYQDTLGLTRVPSKGGAVFQTGGSTLLVYPSEYAGTNRATAATWIVGKELDDIVRTLESKGVTFEHYDLPDTRREGHIHIAGPIRNAWCKDPDGNVLAFVDA